MDSSRPLVLGTKSLKKSNQGGTHHEKNCYECLAAVLLSTIAATSAFAAGRGAGFTDSDGDGVCDYYGTGRGAGCGRGGRWA